MAVRLDPFDAPSDDKVLQVHECLEDVAWEEQHVGISVGEVWAKPGDWLVRRAGQVVVMLVEEFALARDAIPAGRIYD